MQLSLVLPAYNERAIIGESVRTADAYLRTLGLSYELIVGDDGSTDDTASAAREADLASVRVVRRPHAGKGSILTACFLETTGEYAGFLDADLEIAVSVVGDLISALDEGYDAAIASKSLADGFDRRPWKRRVITWGYNTIVRWLFGSHLSDHQAGAKMFRGDYLRSIMPSMTSRGWLWDTEVLVTMIRDGKRIREVPVPICVQRASHVPGSQTALGVTLALWELRRQMRQRNRCWPEPDRQRIPH